MRVYASDCFSFGSRNRASLLVSCEAIRWTECCSLNTHEEGFSVAIAVEYGRRIGLQIILMCDNSGIDKM